MSLSFLEVSKLPWQPSSLCCLLWWGNVTGNSSLSNKESTWKHWLPVYPCTVRMVEPALRHIHSRGNTSNWLTSILKSSTSTAIEGAQMPIAGRWNWFNWFEEQQKRDTITTGRDRAKNLGRWPPGQWNKVGNLGRQAGMEGWRWDARVYIRYIVCTTSLITLNDRPISPGQASH